MTRSKNYDITEVTTTIMMCFIKNGYAGTSLDTLVQATGILRGSLYAAFGSKRGMFIAVLELLNQDTKVSPAGLDIASIALLELTSKSDKIKALTAAYLSKLPTKDLANRLGQQLLIHGQLTKEAKHG